MYANPYIICNYVCTIYAFVSGKIIFVVNHRHRAIFIFLFYYDLKDSENHYDKIPNIRKLSSGKIDLTEVI
jgi:hypothetical protein